MNRNVDVEVNRPTTWEELMLNQIYVKLEYMEEMFEERIGSLEGYLEELVDENKRLREIVGLEG